MDPNADQIAYWNGPAAERWASEQEAIDGAFAPFTVRLLEVAALRPGQRVIDVGCGCGTTSLAGADAVGPTGEVVGIDVSAPMLARAMERSSGRANVTYLLADASTVRFDRSFDVALSRLGVMFFREPARAFANLRSALRPGGRIAFVCWRAAADNEWVRVPYEAAVAHVPPGPAAGPEEPGPFSFADASRVKRILDEAGFSHIAIAPFDAPVVLSERGVEQAVHFAITNGPTARLIREAGDAAKERVRESLETTLRPFAQESRVALDGAVWVVTGVARP